MRAWWARLLAFLALRWLEDLAEIAAGQRAVQARMDAAGRALAGTPPARPERSAGPLVTLQLMDGDMKQVHATTQVPVARRTPRAAYETQERVWVGPPEAQERKRVWVRRVYEAAAQNPDGSWRYRHVSTEPLEQAGA